MRMSSFSKLGCGYVHFARKCLVINPKYSPSPLSKLLPRHTVTQNGDDKKVTWFQEWLSIFVVSLLLDAC
jgi:hypothetical protein